MRFEVERARALMLQGAPLARRLPGRIGWELRLIVQGGLRILDAIEQADYDVFRRRPTLGQADWLAMLGWRDPDAGVKARRTCASLFTPVACSASIAAFGPSAVHPRTSRS